MRVCVLQPCDNYVNAKEGSMPGVDLSLAVNYIPAVDCLSKTLAITSSMAFVEHQYFLGAFLVIGLMLNIDRLCACTRIFDGNAVLYTVLGSWVINHFRESADVPRFLNPMVTVVWCLFALGLLVEPNSIKPFVLSDAELLVQQQNGSGGNGGWSGTERVDVTPGGGRMAKLRKAAPVLVTTICVGVISFTRMDAEPWARRFFRAVAFSSMCVIWVYLVGVWRRSGGVLNTFTQNLVGRFCPVLFVNSVCSVLFVGACLVGFWYLYYHMHCLDSNAGGAVVESHSVGSRECRDEPMIMLSQSASQSLSCSMSTIAEEETDEDLEACFRSARQARVGGGGGGGFDRFEQSGEFGGM